ncbi:hypothetical protein Pcinc_007751 [Petrolisthes cinctipes]|uniref:Uncharacterized protein n=1 Tax=Petrolisthes cinctipes TaxID=88211 RepID=A0AAE1G8T5_PETCI|nr:hypothetical protein Pcinc_007751 [Petrolisthes cinctipes]
MWDLLLMMVDRMKVRFQILRPPDGLWGVELQNGTWNGMLGMLQRQEVDMALGPFAISYPRTKVADFIGSVFVLPHRVYLPRPRGNSDLSDFVRLYHPLHYNKNHNNINNNKDHNITTTNNHHKTEDHNNKNLNTSDHNITTTNNHNKTEEHNIQNLNTMDHNINKDHNTTTNNHHKTEDHNNKNLNTSDHNINKDHNTTTTNNHHKTEDHNNKNLNTSDHNIRHHNITTTNNHNKTEEHNIRNLNTKDHNNRHHKSSNSNLSAVYLLLRVWGSFLQESTSWQCFGVAKWVMGLWFLATLVVMSTYSGLLVASLTVPRVHIPISSVRQLVGQSRLPWRLEQGGIILHTFKTANVPLYKELLYGSSGVFPDCYAAREDITQGRFAALCDILSGELMIARSFSNSGRCDFYSPRENVVTHSYTLVLQKHSTLKPRLQYW